MKFKNIYLIIAAFTIVAAASCKKELTNVNTNPDAIPAAKYNPNLLLTTVQLMYTGSTSFGGSAWATKWGAAACFIQHTASTNPGFYYGDKYLNNIGAMGEMFQESYTSEVQPVVELYQLTANKPQYRNLHQMARIMKAIVFEQITDLYGDIPYFQAGLGYYNRIYTPAYDKQQVIYTDLLKEVSQAVDSLDQSADAPSGDVLYSNLGKKTQIAEWKEFGNSLLVRMAMRLSKVDSTTTMTYVTKAVAGGTMQSNADNAIVQHQDGNQLTQNRDALEIFGNDSTDLRLASVFVSGMKINKDPRLPVVSWIYSWDNSGNSTGNNTPADQIGMPPGFIVGGNNPAVNITKLDTFPKNGIAGYSRLNDNILNTAAPSLILTYAETELLLAEAAQRWHIGGTAATHYQNGVLAAVTQLAAYGPAATISNADAMTYYNTVAYNGTKALDQINTQYWLCTLMDEYEAWSNWRRTGYPNLKPVNYPGNITNGTIPRRLTYPPSQKITNTTNYNAEVASLTGGDNMTTRVWWDK
jgi:hypothetical protein